MSISQITSEIRDYINHPRVQAGIMANRRDWMQICASLDIVGDTELAISAYASCATPDYGNAYLQIFGLFQAFFLQQDACTHMAEVLSIELPQDAGLAEVRQSRNDIVGHPTKRGNNNARTSHVMSRVSLSKWSVDVVSSTRDTADIEMRQIDFRRLNQIQANGIISHLQLILNEIQNREKEHAMKHADVKLADIFPQTLTYHCSKIFEGIRSAREIPMAQANIKYARGWIEKFRQALTDRDELPGNDNMLYHFNQLDNPFNRIEEYLDGNSPLNEEDVYAIAFFLHAKLKEMAELAAEYDEHYADARSA